MTGSALAGIDQARAKFDADLDLLVADIRQALREGADPSMAATATIQEFLLDAAKDPFRMARVVCLLGCALVREAQRLESVVAS